MQPTSHSRSSRTRIVLGAVALVIGLVLVLAAVARVSRPGGAAGLPRAGASTQTASAAPTTGAPGSAAPGLAASTAPASPAAPGSPGASSIPTPGPDDTVLVAAGDIGRCDVTSDDETGALVATLPGLVATLGDTAYENGTAEELKQCFGGSWGGVKDRIRYAITGNHDIHTANGAPLRAYMGEAAVRDGRTYFSDDLGTWHVVVLDANCGFMGADCGAQSDQVQWLRDDLAASSARCTLALWHQPRFSSGNHGNDRAVGPFWDALYATGAELVLNGHDHEYERFAPQDPSGAPDDARGITEIVVGTGGVPLETFKQVVPTSLVRIDDAYGVLELTLAQDGWTFRFLDTTGAVRDQGNGTCH